MPHELDYNEATGKSAMFSVRELPWHALGIVVQAAPTFDEAIRLAGVDYDVALRPLHYVPGRAVHVPGGDVSVPATLATGTGFAVVRTDREGQDGGVLAVVGDRYEPVQNRDAFATLVPLLDSGVATLETGGTLRGGRDAWMLVKFKLDDPVVREVFAGEVVPYSLLTTNHAARRQVVIMDTPVRVVCANTLGAALSGREAGTSIAVAHRSGARVKLVEAAERLYAGLLDRYRGIAEHYRTMKQTILTVEQFAATVLDVAAPLPDYANTVKPGMVDRTLDNATMRRQALTTAWEYGRGHTGDHSAWEAYNGAVEVLDHDTELYRSKNRIASLVDGTLAHCKRDVLRAVLVECGVPVR